MCSEKNFALFIFCVNLVSRTQHLKLFFSLSVQHECIPQAILGMDILCQAKSGMGKTAVFVLATLQQIEPVDGQVRSFMHCVVFKRIGVTLPSLT